MVPIPEDFEKLKTLDSKENAKIFIENLRKDGIEAKERSLGESGPYEIWVPADKLFSALGISAKFDIDIKKREELKRAGKIDKKRKSKKIAGLAKATLIVIGILVVFSIGYQINRVFVSLGTISKEIKPVPIKIDPEALKADFESLIRESKKMHSKKSKLSLSSLVFRWNLSKAEKAFNNENYDAAMLGLEKCLKKDKENPGVIALLLTTYLKLDLFDDAKVLLKDCYNLPSSDYLWKRWVGLQLAEIYLKEENYFGADYELKEILEIKPDDIVILKKLAEVNSESGDIDQAIKYLERVLIIDEGETASRVFLGKLLFESKILDEAGWNLSRVYEELSDPDEIGEISLMLAEVNFNLGKFSMAKEYLEQAKVVMEDTEGYIFIKAVYDYLNGSYSVSKEGLLRVISNNPEFILAKLYLNLIFLREGRVSEFKDVLEKVFDRCTSNDELSLLHYNFACLELKKNILKKAWDELMLSYEYDKYLFKRFNYDPFIQKLKRSKEYSILLRQLD